jgi:predicted kinase
MSRLIILRGISGSGKSTWARNQNAVVVSRDDLRTALFGFDYHSQTPDFASEELVTAAEHAAIKAALKAGKDVISDNTNLRPKFAQKIADIGYALGAQVEVKVFEVTSSVGMSRVQERARSGGRLVPPEVILKQHSQLAGTKNWKPEFWSPTPYNGTLGMPKAVLFDIDGTLAHMGDKRGPFDWKKVGVDDPDFNVIQLAQWIKYGMRFAKGMEFDRDAFVILMSGRDAVCRPETEDWLDLCEVPFDALFMRPEGDMRKDSIVKDELFENHVAPYYDVVAVFDDRNQVVDMWRAKGLTVCQVAEGDF